METGFLSAETALAEALHDCTQHTPTAKGHWSTEADYRYSEVKSPKIHKVDLRTNLEVCFCYSELLANIHFEKNAWAIQKFPYVLIGSDSSVESAFTTPRVAHVGQ